MGTDVSDFDIANIKMFAKRVVALAEYRSQLQAYLKDRMSDVAPNLSELIGEQVGARLISHAGSLINLAKYPASTLQILGAEKALFRALKTRGNTPKYGLIFHSSFIGRAGLKNKGKISRYLANKCSIAARIDAFSETPSTVFGHELHEQVEERLRFYDKGIVPRKNIEVMLKALADRNESKNNVEGKEMEIEKEKEGKEEEEKENEKDKKKKKKQKKKKKKQKGKRKREEEEQNLEHDKKKTQWRRKRRK